MPEKRKILEHILRFMARSVLMKYRPLVVGITGSVGKSSTKEAVALVLARAYRVRKSEGNYNNEIGVPLTILGVGSGGRSLWQWFLVGLRFMILMVLPCRYPEILVLEMAIDRPGDMAFLLSYVPVRVGIVTQISESHLAFFGTLNNIAKEKGRLIAALPEDGFALLNADDTRTLKMRNKTKAKVLTYGFENQADIRADNLVFHREPQRAEGLSFKVNFDGKTLPVRLPKIVARHHIAAALAALATAVVLKINLVEVIGALEELESLPGRLRLLSGRDHTYILDDTYNASPASTRAALLVMKELMASRKMAILGDMLELGPESDMEHARLSEAIQSAGIHVVVTIGKHMRALHEALLQSGFSRKQVLWMPDPLSAREAILALVRSGDIILVKGSQGLRMELIVEQLLAHPEQASSVLCRQNTTWKKKSFVSPAEWMDEPSVSESA